MYDENEIEIDRAMQAWMLSKCFTADPNINVLIRERVDALLESGGYVSTSHFERAYLELLHDDVIRPFRGSITDQPAAAPAPAISSDVVAFIESSRTSSFEIRKRYASDLTFRKQYDEYANSKLKQQIAAEESEATLALEKYNNMSRIDVVKKYRSSPSFKRGVDRETEKKSEAANSLPFLSSWSTQTKQRR